VPESSAFSIPESPIAALGTITLLCAFLVAAYAGVAGAIGNIQHRRRLVSSAVQALYGLCGLMALASALLIYAFVTHDYSIKYVAHYSDTTMPLAYKITSYWGGLDGSMMFWVTVLSGFSAVAVRTNAARHRDMIGFVVAVIMAVQLFFLAIIIYNKNPFATTLTMPPIDGKGLNPLLQNYWMVIHPPSLYIGYVAATIPFAFGVAALASGRLDDAWLASVRVWTFICWFFLSFGLILGGRWAYEELGWGGYWAWDPVENAGLLPWFTATAFLHAVIIQEQRGMMKVWNLALVIITFVLTIIGTGLTRTGAVQSVHAFGEDNALALLFVLFICVILIGSVGLLLHRLPRLRSAASFESFMSREFAFLLNNWILLACALFVFFATMWPTISEAFIGHRITYGPPVFNLYMIPLGLTLLFLAGAAPLLAYRRTTPDRLKAQFIVPLAAFVITVATVAILFPRTRELTAILHDKIRLPMSLLNFGLVAFLFTSVGQEFWRGMRVRAKQTGSGHLTSLIGLIGAKRRKYGGYVVHIAVAIMFFGFAGKAFEGMRDFTVSKPGDSFHYRGYTFRYDRLDAPSPKSDDNKDVSEAHVSLFLGDKVTKDGLLDVMKPARWRFAKEPDQPTTEVYIKSYLEEDVYLILTGFATDPAGHPTEVNFRVYINPLINWVWLGFFFLMLGTMICLLPQRWVDSAQGVKRTRVGRLGEGVVILLVIGGVLTAAARMAIAQPRAEHESSITTGRASHDVAAAHLFRPDGPEFLAPFRQRAADAIKATQPGIDRTALARQVEVEVAPVAEVAKKAMADLVCMCGGCTRETIYECKCGHAASEREKILNMLSTRDLLTETGRAEAYAAVLAAFQAEYDGAHVLIKPEDSDKAGQLGWVVPYVLVAAGLGLIYATGRRWVRRGKADMAAAKAGPAVAAAEDVENEDYADKLDDELRDTD
jgi:cytochrome c-type biogenesis protein CcmF